MARILEIEEIAPAFKSYIIHNPVIARRHRAGQLAARSIDCYLNGVTLVPEVDVVDDAREFGAPRVPDSQTQTRNRVH